MEKGGPIGNPNMILKKQMKMGYGYGKMDKVIFSHGHSYCMSVLMIVS